MYNVFGSPVDGADVSSHQSRHEIIRKRDTQVRAPNLHAVDSLVHEFGAEAPANGFNFGKLGHSDSLRHSGTETGAK